MAINIANITSFTNDREIQISSGRLICRRRLTSNYIISLKLASTPLLKAVEGRDRATNQKARENSTAPVYRQAYKSPSGNGENYGEIVYDINRYSLPRET